MLSAGARSCFLLDEATLARAVLRGTCFKSTGAELDERWRILLFRMQALLPLLRPLAEAAFPGIGSESVRLQQLMTVTAIVPACPYRIATATRIREHWAL